MNLLTAEQMELASRNEAVPAYGSGAAEHRHAEWRGICQAQAELTIKEVGELLHEYSKGAHANDDGFFWHFEIPREKLKKLFSNYSW